MGPRLSRAAACAMNCMDQTARWWEPPAVPVFHKNLANKGNRPFKPPKMVQNGAEMVPNFVGDRAEGHNRLGPAEKGSDSGARFFGRWTSQKGSGVKQNAEIAKAEI